MTAWRQIGIYGGSLDIITNGRIEALAKDGHVLAAWAHVGYEDGIPVYRINYYEPRTTIKGASDGCSINRHA